MQERKHFVNFHWNNKEEFFSRMRTSTSGPWTSSSLASPRCNIVQEALNLEAQVGCPRKMGMKTCLWLNWPCQKSGEERGQSKFMTLHGQCGSYKFVFEKADKTTKSTFLRRSLTNFGKKDWSKYVFVRSLNFGRMRRAEDVEQETGLAPSIPNWKFWRDPFFSSRDGTRRRGIKNGRVWGGNMAENCKEIREGRKEKHKSYVFFPRNGE